MHIQTHVLSGWCVGNLFRLTGRERLCCMLAASVPDLDGLGILAGVESYWEYHHKVGHNLPAALLVTALLWAVSGRRAAVALLYFGLFHLHLVLDYFGSGPGWEMFYLWPFSHWTVEYRYAWDFYSWQNLLAGAAMVGWVVWIAVRRGRTPLECLMPRLDGQLVGWLRQVTTRRGVASRGV